jgi:hypothetical protein
MTAGLGGPPDGVFEGSGLLGASCPDGAGVPAVRPVETEGLGGSGVLGVPAAETEGLGGTDGAGGWGVSLDGTWSAFFRLTVTVTKSFVV